MPRGLVMSFYFNGILAFVGYLMQSHPSRRTVIILTHSWEEKGAHTLSKGMNPKMHLIARLENGLFTTMLQSSMLTVTPR